MKDFKKFLFFALIGSNILGSLVPASYIEEERFQDPRPLGPVPESLQKLVGQYNVRTSFELLSLRIKRSGQQEGTLLILSEPSIKNFLESQGLQNNQALIVPSNNSLEAWFSHPFQENFETYKTNLPTQGELKKLQEFLKSAPKSLEIDDGGDFYNQFLILIKELEKTKLRTTLAQQKLDTLLALGTQFFGNLQVYGNCWLIDQAQGTNLNPPPLSMVSNAQSPDSIHAAYASAFKEKFLVFQRTCNYFFEVLGANKMVDLQSFYGTLPSAKVKIVNWDKAQDVKLGFVRDVNGYLPFYAGPYKGLEMVDINYGEAITVNNIIYPRTILVDKDKIIFNKGLVLSPYDHPLLPMALKMYGGNGFCTWKDWTYFNKVMNSQTHPLTKYLSQIFDFNDVIKNRNHKFMALPTTSKDKTFVTLMLLETLIKEKASQATPQNLLGLIKALESEVGDPIETIKQSLEDEILESIIEEERRKEENLFPLENQESTVPGITGTNNTTVTTTTTMMATTTVATTTMLKSQKVKKHKGNKSKATKAVSPKGQSQGQPSSQRRRLSTEELRAKAQGILENYKVEGRQRFKEVTSLLNLIFKDKDSFKSVGVDLTKALANMKVTDDGSHFTYHIEGAQTTTTLVNKHKKARDNKYHANEVNGFTESLITQILSSSFKQN